MSTKRRRRFSTEKKLRIVEKQCQSDATISEARRRYQIAISQFYMWERQAVINVALVHPRFVNSPRVDDGRQEGGFIVPLSRQRGLVEII